MRTSFLFRHQRLGDERSTESPGGGKPLGLSPSLTAAGKRDRLALAIVAKGNQMSLPSKEAAREVLSVVPLIMRTIREEMRGCRSRGLSVPQFRSLGFVHRHAGASLSDVAEHIGLTLPAMSRMIDGLVEGKLMVRQSRSADRRCVTLDLTPRGRRLLESALAKVQAVLTTRFEALSEAETKGVVRTMRMIRPLFARKSARGVSEDKAGMNP